MILKKEQKKMSILTDFTKCEQMITNFEVNWTDTDAISSGLMVKFI